MTTTRTKAARRAAPRDETPPPEQHLEGAVAAVFVKTSSLVPWKKNPRKNDAAVDKVAAAIQRFGFGAPIVAQESSRRIVAGHTRWKAAQQLGLDVVPVRFLPLSNGDASAAAIADNRLGELAEWDLPVLSDVLKGFDVDLRAFTGWEPHELDALIAGPGDAGTDGLLPGRNAGPYRIELEPKDARVFERALARHRKKHAKATAGELVGAWANAALAR